MDFFQHRYYRINKMLLMSIGLWPYQSSRARCRISSLIFLFLIGQIVPQILTLVKYRADSEVILECIPLSIFSASCVMKMVCGILNSEKMLKLLNRIRDNWKLWTAEREINICDEYAKQGRKLTIFYADLLMWCIVTLYSSSVIVIIQPVMPKIIGILFLKNYSEPGEFPVTTNYYRLDMQKYYFYIIMHIFVSISVGNLIMVAWGTMFIVYVHHGCGIFAVLGNKIEQIGVNGRSAKTGEAVPALDKPDMDFRHLVTCIDRHNDAIEYAKLMEGTYSWCFFFLVGFNMITISLSGLQIVKKSANFHETIRFIVLNTLIMVHLYLETYMAQTLMDHSIRIHHYLHNVKWYKLSLKARKLLPLMMMRCNEPCKLTAGNISIMSVETFGVILKTSLSYFTFLRSI